MTTSEEQLRIELKAMKEKRPYHQHVDPDTDERWICFSPYCTSVEISKSDWDAEKPKGYK